MERKKGHDNNATCDVRTGAEKIALVPSGKCTVDIPAADSGVAIN
jgi:hypothetical protein